MTLPIRLILAVSILVIVLAACATAVGAPTSPSQSPSPSEPATPPVEPSAQPTVDPSGTPAPAPEKRDVAGTITVFEGGTFSGPGATIQEALNAGPSGEYPALVNGVLFRDPDGTVYLATSVSDLTVPTFDGPMLEVLNTPTDGPSWDMANAEMLGLEEANGIVFNQGVQVLGFLEIN